MTDQLNNNPQALKTRDELDKRIFHLQAIYDLTAELSPLTDTQKLLDTFLLMILGTFSVGQGFVLVYDRREKIVALSDRGLEHKATLSPEFTEKLLYQCLDVSAEKTLAPMSVTNLTAPDLFKTAGLSPATEYGLMFVVDSQLMGIIGLGPRISDTDFSKVEKTLLVNYVSNFMVFLKNARSFEMIQALNKDLEQQNEQLRKTIAELTEARHKITTLEKAKAQIKMIVQAELERAGRVRILDFVLILAVAMLVGLVFNFFSPNGIPLVSESIFRPSPALIDVAEAKKIIDTGTGVLVDARPNEFYRQEHIKGAINLPPALFDFIYMMKLSKLDPKKKIIVYGRNISKRYDEEVAYRLTQRDHEDIKVLAGGLSAWSKEGYPLEP
ncbi:MAG: rhodanese-like domain-containing protein [Desulfobacterales bacterium]|nr:rhodanese-like domain-containing protein [Desulfobacterales bacterium]